MTEITQLDLEVILKRNPELRILEAPNEPMPKTRKRSKYRAERTEYNGVWYDSKKEAETASYLDFEMAAGDVEWWCRQPQFILPGGVIYKPDFIVKRPEQIIVVDVKGIRTKEYRIKKRQVEAIYKIKIEEW